jgi:glycosyltransferase involved in cell wall biosynthesis
MAERTLPTERPSTAAATSVVIPAFNEAAAIACVLRDLRHVAAWHELLVVDDGSSDDTGATAMSAGARVIRHPHNLGNGAAVKTGIRQATGTFVLILDGDGQHRAADAARLVARLDTYDLVVGARSPGTQATAARRLGNSMLNWIASYLTEQRIPDLTSGFRAARRDRFAEFLHLLPNGFSTPTTTTLAFMKAGFSVHFEPIEAARRTGGVPNAAAAVGSPSGVPNAAAAVGSPSASKIRLGSDGLRFFLILLKVITIFSPLRIFLPISAAAFCVGAAYAVWTIFTQSHVTNSSVLLIVLSVVIFLVGLVSEQISSLRFEGRR